MFFATAQRACFVHNDRLATKELNIPCAPGGKLHVCEECARPESTKMVFDAYRASHEQRIVDFRRRQEAPRG